MTRHLKSCGLALVAVFAINVGFASPASATTLQWHSAIATTTHWFSSNTTQLVWSVTGGKVKCKKGTSVSTTGSSTTSELTVTTAASECTAFGQAATVTTNGCTDTLTEPTGTPGAYRTSIHTKCTEGKKVVISVPTGNCSVEFGEQTPTTGTLDLTDEGAGETRDILVTATVSGMSYTVVGPGTVCGTVGAATNGEYAGTSTLKGYKNEAHTEQVGVWVE